MVEGRRATPFFSVSTKVAAHPPKGKNSKKKKIKVRKNSKEYARHVEITTDFRCLPQSLTAKRRSHAADDSGYR